MYQTLVHNLSCKYVKVMDIGLNLRSHLVGCIKLVMNRGVLVMLILDMDYWFGVSKITYIQ